MYLFYKKAIINALIGVQFLHVGKTIWQPVFLKHIYIGSTPTRICTWSTDMTSFWETILLLFDALFGGRIRTKFSSSKIIFKTNDFTIIHSVWPFQVLEISNISRDQWHLLSLHFQHSKARCANPCNYHRSNAFSLILAKSAISQRTNVICWHAGFPPPNANRAVFNALLSMYCVLLNSIKLTILVRTNDIWWHASVPSSKAYRAATKNFCRSNVFSVDYLNCHYFCSAPMIFADMRVFHFQV